jgi:myosin heavy subunit
MESGARVWISDADGDAAWILAEVTSRTDKQLHAKQVFSPNAKSNSSKTLTFTRPRIEAKAEEAIELKYQGVELANALLSEQEKAEGKDDDMITLPHLHEPAILHAVGERFNRGEIYTWTGPVLIAVNPFQRLPLYTKVRD